MTSGKKRESLLGNATMHLYPQIKELSEIHNIIDYIGTEISTSKQKQFNLITFIDTPGLVDGDMKYPFDVNTAILWFGAISDLIFVFFDPIGQALCKRTLNIVEKLNETHGSKIRFNLSKADEAGSDTDRQVKRKLRIYFCYSIVLIVKFIGLFLFKESFNANRSRDM